MKLSCEICNVPLSSDALMQDHLRGKKHQRMMKIHEKEQEKMKYQAYVTWKKKDLDRDMLREFALKYGPVENLHFDADKQFGIIHFRNSQSCCDILSTDKHTLSNGIEIFLKPRLFERNKEKPLQKKNVPNQKKTEDCTSTAAEKLQQPQKHFVFSDEFQKIICTTTETIQSATISTSQKKPKSPKLAKTDCEQFNKSLLTSPGQKVQSNSSSTQKFSSPSQKKPKSPKLAKTDREQCNKSLLTSSGPKVQSTSSSTQKFSSKVPMTQTEHLQSTNVSSFSGDRAGHCPRGSQFDKFTKFSPKDHSKLPHPPGFSTKKLHEKNTENRTKSSRAASSFIHPPETKSYHKILQSYESQLNHEQRRLQNDQKQQQTTERKIKPRSPRVRQQQKLERRQERRQQLKKQREKNGEVETDGDRLHNDALLKEILSSLLNCSSVDEQMNTLVKQLQLSRDDEMSREQIVIQLKRYLQPIFEPAEVDIHIFGSSANGLGIRDCDLDLVLSVDTPLEIKAIMKKVKSRLSSDQRFAHVFAIQSKRCPIVRFTWVPQALKCDLSFNNRLATENTNVLFFLCQVVAAFRPLCFVIRQWAKVVNVAGNVNGGPKMTHYALYMLTWHFLRSTLNLPSFEDLANCEAKKNQIDKWDCTFPFSQPHLLTPTSPIPSLTQLLAGFFDFYKDMNFKDHVINLRTGRMVPVEDYSPLPLFKFTSIMVQDPFLLEHNVTHNMTSDVLARMQRAMREASIICSLPAFSSKAIVEDAVSTSGNDKTGRTWGIGLLLSQKPVEEEKAVGRRVFSVKLPCLTSVRDVDRCETVGSKKIPDETLSPSIPIPMEVDGNGEAVNDDCSRQPVHSSSPSISNRPSAEHESRRSVEACFKNFPVVIDENACERVCVAENLEKMAQKVFTLLQKVLKDIFLIDVKGHSPFMVSSSTENNDAELVTSSMLTSVDARPATTTCAVTTTASTSTTALTSTATFASINTSTPRARDLSDPEIRDTVMMIINEVIDGMKDINQEDAQNIDDCVTGTIQKTECVVESSSQHATEIYETAASSAGSTIPEALLEPESSCGSSALPSVISTASICHEHPAKIPRLELGSDPTSGYVGDDMEENNCSTASGDFSQAMCEEAQSDSDTSSGEIHEDDENDDGNNEIRDGEMDEADDDVDKDVHHLGNDDDEHQLDDDDEHQLDDDDEHQLDDDEHQLDDDELNDISGIACCEDKENDDNRELSHEDILQQSSSNLPQHVGVSQLPNLEKLEESDIYDRKGRRGGEYYRNKYGRKASSNPKKTEDHQPECSFELDCRSTFRTWVGRSRYRQYFPGVKEVLSKEMQITQKMASSLAQFSGVSSHSKENQKGNLGTVQDDNFEECEMPFTLKVTVKPLSSRPDEGTTGRMRALFQVNPNADLPWSRRSDFNNMVNGLINLLIVCLKDLDNGDSI